MVISDSKERKSYLKLSKNIISTRYPSFEIISSYFFLLWYASGSNSTTLQQEKLPPPPSTIRRYGSTIKQQWDFGQNPIKASVYSCEM